MGIEVTCEEDSSNWSDIAKYVLGYYIHQTNKQRRQKISREEDHLGKRVLKIGANYVWEGARLAYRYTPLLYEVTAVVSLPNNPFISLEFIFYGTVIRASDLVLTQLFKVPKVLDEYSPLLTLLSSPEMLEKVIFLLIGSNPKLKAMWNNKLLDDPYAVLELPDTASDVEVNKAYRKLSQKYHPDKNDGGTPETDKQFILSSKAVQQIRGEYHRL